MLIRRFLYWIRSAKRAAALREEMDFHIEEKAAELRETGLSEEDARVAAGRRSGNVSLKQEECREIWSRRIRTILEEPRYCPSRVRVYWVVPGRKQKPESPVSRRLPLAESFLWSSVRTLPTFCWLAQTDGNRKSACAWPLAPRAVELSDNYSPKQYCSACSARRPRWLWPMFCRA